MSSLDTKKLRELVLYICRRCESRPRFSTAALYKLLYRSDFTAYRELGRPITSATYCAQRDGPVPDAESLAIIRDGMTAARELALQHSGGVKRYVALREPDLALFSGAEIALVDRVIERFKHKPAKDVEYPADSEVLAWLAGRAEHIASGRSVAIPYGAALVSSPVLDEFEEQHARELASKHRWPT